MASASQLRVQLETALADRVPSALTPRPRMIRPMTPTGVDAVDALLDGGLPVGAMTEIVGPESSGRTSLALSAIAQLTAAGKVCAWVDVGDMLRPECAAAAGIALPYLLWVRCGVVRAQNTNQSHPFALPETCLVRPDPVKGLHGGGCGTHPREESKGLARALPGFFGKDNGSKEPAIAMPAFKRESLPLAQQNPPVVPISGWSRIEQALKTTDLLLQAGGFSAVVLDMGSLSAKYVSRIPLSHWFRYRAAAEHCRSSVLLLTQHACANSSAALVLRLAGERSIQHDTVLAGGRYRMRVHRHRFVQEQNTKVVPLKKPVAKVTEAEWETRAHWAGRK